MPKTQKPRLSGAVSSMNPCSLPCLSLALQDACSMLNTSLTCRMRDGWGAGTSLPICTPCRSFQRRFHMATPPEGSQVVGGLCGATAEELSSPLHPPLDGPVVIRTHVLE